MADAKRNEDNAMIESNLDLKIQHYRIRINEQLGQIKNLELTIERYKAVDIKKTELARDVAMRELEQMRKDLHQMELRYKSVDTDVNVK